VGRPHHILLVPGFFGFANLGDFTYFGHVRNFIAEKGPELGLDGEVRVARTEPTASLARRAALLCEALSKLLDESPGDVSLVGHSSGGLDARLVVTPGAVLPTPADVERCARSVRSVVTPCGALLAARNATRSPNSVLKRLLASRACVPGSNSGTIKA